MKCISITYELYTKSITDLFESCSNNEHNKSCRGIKSDTAGGLHSDKEFSSTIRNSVNRDYRKKNIQKSLDNLKLKLNKNKTFTQYRIFSSF